MKGHIGVDSQRKLIHSVAATPAKVYDSRVLPELLHGNETGEWGDTAYTRQTVVIRRAAPYAQDFMNKKENRHHPLSVEVRAKNRTKSKVRARGEHPLLALKRIFGFTKVRGNARNANRLFVACVLANLYMTRRIFATCIGSVRLLFAEPAKIASENESPDEFGAKKHRYRRVRMTHDQKFDFSINRSDLP